MSENTTKITFHPYFLMEIWVIFEICVFVTYKNTFFASNFHNFLSFAPFISFNCSFILFNFGLLVILSSGMFPHTFEIAKWPVANAANATTSKQIAAVLTIVLLISNGFFAYLALFTSCASQEIFSSEKRMISLVQTHSCSKRTNNIVMRWAYEMTKKMKNTTETCTNKCIE